MKLGWKGKLRRKIERIKHKSRQERIEKEREKGIKVDKCSSGVGETGGALLTVGLHWRAEAPTSPSPNAGIVAPFSTPEKCDKWAILFVGFFCVNICLAFLYWEAPLVHPQMPGSWHLFWHQKKWPMCNIFCNFFLASLILAPFGTGKMSNVQFVFRLLKLVCVLLKSKSPLIHPNSQTHGQNPRLVTSQENENQNKKPTLIWFWANRHRTWPSWSQTLTLAP